MVDDEGEGHQDERKEEHVGACVAVHGKIDVELTGKDEQDKHERKDGARPDEYQDTQDDEECVPEGEGNRFRDVLVDAAENRCVYLFCTKQERLRMRIDEVEGNGEA